MSNIVFPSHPPITDHRVSTKFCIPPHINDHPSVMEFCIPPTMLDCIPLMLIVLACPPRILEARALTWFPSHPTIELADALSLIRFVPPHHINDKCIVFVDPVIVLFCHHTMLDQNGTDCVDPPTMFPFPPTILELADSIILLYPHTILLAFP